MNNGRRTRRGSLAVPGAALAMLVLMFAAAVAAEELVPSFDLNWFTLDHGGGISGGNGFDLHGTIGQLDAAPEMSGGSIAGTLTMSAGYWPGVEPVPPCPGDVAPGTSGDGMVNITDLLAIIAAWGSSNPQFDIAPGNGDGIVNIQDLLFVISVWGLCPV